MARHVLVRHHVVDRGADFVHDAIEHVTNNATVVEQKRHVFWQRFRGGRQVGRGTLDGRRAAVRHA